MLVKMESAGSGGGGGNAQYYTQTKSISSSTHVEVQGRLVFVYGWYNYSPYVNRFWGTADEFYFQTDNNTIEHRTDIGAFTQIDDTHCTFATGTGSTYSVTLYYVYE